MPNRIRILHLEDQSGDSEAVERLLTSGDVTVSLLRVEGEHGFVEALRSDHFDLILSDYSLPACHGPRALELAREIRPELPFIFLSGKRGEDLVVESLKQGAMDYVLKRQLPRLPSAVERAIKENKVLREKAQADREMRERRDELEKVNCRLAREIENPMAFVTLNLGRLTGYTHSLKLVLAGYGNFAQVLRESRDPALLSAKETLGALMKAEKLERIYTDLDGLLSETWRGVEQVNEIVESLKRVARRPSS